ncbi:hypothetical protein L2E82_50549 [Cichorium intybus]|nr:hypothetical protein L2E82_50549 [Cichorium intybus]
MRVLSALKNARVFTSGLVKHEVVMSQKRKYLTFRSDDSLALSPFRNEERRFYTSCDHSNSGEGRFDILSLSGPFVPNENLEAKKWSRGMSVSLAGPDGRVLGGGLAGMLAAAGLVQVRNYDFAPKM